MDLKNHFLEILELAVVLVIAYLVSRFFPSADQTVVFGLVTVVLDRLKDVTKDHVTS